MRPKQRGWGGEWGTAGAQAGEGVGVGGRPWVSQDLSPGTVGMRIRRGAMRTSDGSKPLSTNV